MGYSPRGHKESDTTERLHFTSLCKLYKENLVHRHLPSPRLFTDNSRASVPEGQNPINNSVELPCAVVETLTAARQFSLSHMLGNQECIFRFIPDGIRALELSSSTLG